ncbi:MAG: sensor domain-containing diguanylate cyclase [Pseudomonadota bacterium]|nr:MAG: sensor domain-containing diguanylate cyclase [Pseudomonadota bacterium]
MTERRFRSLNDPSTLSRLVQRLPAGVYITNEQGRILDANPACLELFGVESLETLQGLDVRSLFVDPEQRGQQLSVLEATRALQQYELRLQRPDGEQRTVIDTCYAVEDPETGHTLYHGILLDISERKRLEERLRELTVKDPLTGCYNRRRLPMVESQVEANDDAGLRQWGCVLVDVDHFKTYNDQHGHDAGDRVLQRVAHFLQSQVSRKDAVVRIGGDEFLVIVTGRSALKTAQIAARLISTHSPIPISIGWAVREDDERLETTIHRADEQLISTRQAERSMIS